MTSQGETRTKIPEYLSIVSLFLSTTHTVLLFSLAMVI